MSPYKVLVKENILLKDMFYKEDLVMSYTIKYPTFVSAKFQMTLKKINYFYRLKALMYQKFNLTKLYKMAMEEYEYSVAQGFPIRKYEAFVDYQITYNQNCALSLYFDKYEYTGGAHGNTMRNSDTWDLQTGKEIKLNDIFSDESNYQDYIFHIIYDIISNETKEGNNPYFDDYQQLVKESFNKNNFYLNGEGVVIYFQQYDIAPYSTGIPTFTIPYSTGEVTPPKCNISILI